MTDAMNISLTHDSPHNPDSCKECIRRRIKDAEAKGETPDMHDLIAIKNGVYGGNW